MRAEGPAPYRRRTACRLCGSTDLVGVLHLTSTPPANAFVTAADKDLPQEVFPLDLHFCEVCAHVQLLTVVDPSLLFSNYVYVSGTSPVFVAHFERYAAAMIRRLDLKPGDLVVDIGSNDGTLLRFFQQAGQRTLGVDPARAIAEAATASGVETWNAFFDQAVAARIKSDKGPARLVTANNVFAHIDDPVAVLLGIRDLLAPDGLFVFEVSYLADVFEQRLFDTIYHEHLDYHSVAPLVGFFRRHGMEVVAVERVDSHGGSIRVMVKRADGPAAVEESVADMVALERRLGLDRTETLQDFGRRIDAVGRDLGDLLRSLKADGKRIAGYGAPAKATTLLYHFGLGGEIIDFIAEDSPLKQGMFTPGLHIPVISPQALYTSKPDYVVVLAWNFAPSIMSKHEAFAAMGGRFIVPLPTVTVH